MQPELPQPGGPLRLLHRPPVAVRIEDREQHRVAVQQEVRVVRRRHEVDRLPDPDDRLRAALPHRAHARPAHGRPIALGGRDRPGPVTAERDLQQIDEDVVREPGHREIGQLLRRAVDVQGGADAGPGLVHQGEQPARVPPVGDVEDHVSDADPPVPGVRQWEERAGVRPPAMRIGPAPAQVLVVRDRPAGRQDLSHQPFQRVRQRPGQHLAGPAAQPLLPGHAAEPLQRVVDPEVAQFGVEDRHPDR